MKAYRVFIAVEIPALWQEALGNSLNALTKKHPTVRWIRPENFHITLVFLGPWDEAQIPVIAQACQAAAADQPGFGLVLEGLGGFPSEHNAQNIWAGVGLGKEPLMALQSAVAEKLRQAGMTIDPRPFVPHVTLGRSQSRNGVRLSHRTWRAPSLGETRVEEMVLMHSDLQPGGPVYTVLDRFRLAG